MSLSGIGAQRGYSARQMLESALRRAGIPPNKWTSEIIDIAYDVMNLMLDDMLNLGIQLWGREQIILPLYANRNEVPTPINTSLIISTSQRTLTRVTPLLPFSDNGGDPLGAFDDDFATACTQLTANGAIGTVFDGMFQVSCVGILFNRPGTFGIFYEYSVDGGVTWVSIDSADITILTDDNTWVWKDIEGVPPTANAFRIRSLSVVPLSVAELYIGGNPTDIPMGVWSLDEWNAMPVKETPGPPWNWYQQRNLDSPVLFLWPMPNDAARYLSLVCWRRRYLDQVTSMTQSLDISRRWNEACTASLARRLCAELPEAQYGRMGDLSNAETQSLMLAAAEERDPAPIRYNPGLQVYRF